MPALPVRSSPKRRDRKEEQSFNKKSNMRSTMRSEPTKCRNTCGWNAWALSDVREGHSIKRKWYDPRFANPACGVHMHCDGLVVKCIVNALEASGRPSQLTNDVVLQRQRRKSICLSCFSKSRWPAGHAFFSPFTESADSGSGAALPTAIIHLVRGLSRWPPHPSTLHTPISFPWADSFWHVCIFQMPYSFFININPPNMITYTPSLSFILLLQVGK